ncbi:MAG TPA: protein kinase [Steroidobacteraceae bacterium]|nr:protein kinase [Steroidobacteraceae bacterium]
MSLSIPEMAVMSRLLDEALPLDAEGRRRWLDALSPEYCSLADALREALLPASPSDGSVEPIAEVIGSCISRIRVSPRPGDPVGPYRLIRLLGAGGMAEVWLAERADGAFKREVALKLPMLLQLRADLASRFGRERDILAALEHPNIARLYDAGVSSDGLPYLAMEYVAGEPLTTWCDAHRLDVRQRVKVFLQVLDAVQYAHTQRIIHRDIKPSNILVTASGQVRLLDFGIAKLLVEEDPKTDLTRRYGGALTADYASPESVRGERVGAASDVYSLGVVLYELLTGSRPYQLEGGTSMLQLELAIAEVEVRRPSTRIRPGAAATRDTTERRLARRLKGDLDAIALKALAKPLSDRYDSATALADDLQRSLSGEPVDARPARLGYRGAKFVLRHRTGFGAAAATVFLAGALAYALVRGGAGSLNIGMASTAAAGEKSIAVLPFIDLSQKKDEEYFSEGLSEELIDHLVHSADLKVIARTSSFQFKGRSEDVRAIARKLGVTHILEGSVRRNGEQLRISAQLIRASDGVDLWSQSYDRTLPDIFKVQNEIAEEVSQSLRVALLGTLGGTRSVPNVRAYDLVLEGNYFKARLTARDTERAIELYRQAIGIDPGYALTWARLASAYLVQEVLSGSQSPSQSSRVTDALARAIRLDPKLAWAYYTRAGFEMNVAWNWAAAQADTQRVRAIDPRFELLPGALGDLALVLGSAGEAVAQYQEALARNPLDPSTLNSLGIALCAADRLEECLQSRLSLLRMHPEFGGAQSAVGIAQLRLRRFGEALQAIEKERSDDYRLGGLAMVYWGMGRRKDSDAALDSLTSRFGPTAAYEIATVHAFRGETDDAFQWLDRAYRAHDSGMLGLKTDPLLRSLRGDRRFPALLSRMRLAIELRTTAGGTRTWLRTRGARNDGPASLRMLSSEN